MASTSPRGPGRHGAGEPGAYNARVRAQLRTGDVLLFKGSVALSRVIESVEGGEYSHSAFILRWGTRAMVVQAELPRLEAVPTSIAVKRYSGRVDWYRIPDADYAKLNVDKLTREATHLLGRPFAVFDLIRVGFYNVLHMPIPKERHPDLALFCSEYVARCFDAAGYPLCAKKDAHAVTPDDFKAGGKLQFQSTIHWDETGRRDALLRGFDTPEAPCGRCTVDDEASG